VPPDDIDAATFTEVVEALLDHDLPAVRPKFADDALHDPRVNRIAQAIERRPAPASLEPELDLQVVWRRGRGPGGPG
jgi:hypothetical protein